MTSLISTVKPTTNVMSSIPPDGQPDVLYSTDYKCDIHCPSIDDQPNIHCSTDHKYNVHCPFFTNGIVQPTTNVMSSIPPQVASLTSTAQPTTNVMSTVPPQMTSLTYTVQPTTNVIPPYLHRLPA